MFLGALEAPALLPARGQPRLPGVPPRCVCGSRPHVVGMRHPRRQCRHMQYQELGQTEHNIKALSKGIIVHTCAASLGLMKAHNYTVILDQARVLS